MTCASFRWTGGRIWGPRIRQWMGTRVATWRARRSLSRPLILTGNTSRSGDRISPSSEHQSLIERFTRLGAETLLYEYTVTDPATWVRPWTAEVPMTKSSDLVYEYACHEGNYSMSVRLAGARAMEKAATASGSR